MSETPNSWPKLEDVAALSRTSPITVSRALRHPKAVAPKTLARIMAAVDALGYVPNLTASNLATQRSGMLGVLVPTIGYSIFSETVRGLADAIKDSNLQLLIGEFDYSDLARYKLVRALIGHRVDALVLVGSIHDEPARALLKHPKTPVVETWELDDAPVDMAVGFSNYEAGITVARHFVETGRKHCAFVGELVGRAAIRLAGFQAGLAQAATRAAETYNTPPGLAIKAGRDALNALLEVAPDIDAIFFATDVMAIGALLECQQRGINVPGRIAIAGLGDLEIGREFHPSLTTVRIPAYEMGRGAGELILARLARDNEPIAKSVVDLGFSLLVRETT